jgi:hypothetical protein
VITRSRFLAGLFVFGSFALLASGCGGAADPGVKVTGSVTKGGKPDAGVKVAFIPDDKAKGTGKGAQTDANGKFELKVPPGQYSVYLTKYVDSKGNVPKDSENPDEDFAQLEASGKLKQVYPEDTPPFKVDIPAEGKQLTPFDVK